MYYESQFIPLIRFVEISPADFLDKFCPYEAVIPRHIFKEVADYYHKGILPKTINMVPRIPSTIIKPNLAIIIANWIDRNDSTVLSYYNHKFDLIYLKSRDGFNCTTFNNKCNGKGPFVVLIKLQSKKIYGGYNPIGYALRRGQWLTSSESFIFSFENNQDMQNMKIGRVINSSKSIQEKCYWIFFNFGWHLCLNKRHLYLGNNGNYNDIFNFDNVEKICLPIEEIEEIEVFSINR